MAKKQTRRSISINRPLYEQAKAIAAATGTPLSKFTEDAITSAIRVHICEKREAAAAAAEATRG